MKFVSFNFSKYKCFVNNVEFVPPKLVNLIIGRNNCGKTTLVDFFQSIYFLSEPPIVKPGEASVFCTPDEADIKNISIIIKQNFLSIESINPDFTLLKDSLFCFDISFAQKVAYGFKQDKSKISSIYAGKSISIANVDAIIRNSNQTYHLFRLSADRSVGQEEMSQSQVSKNGAGLTGIISHYINHASGDRQFIKELTDDLNEILYGEEKYDRMLALLKPGGYYELYFADGSNEIPISQMGNGIKTILLVLYMLKAAEKSHAKSGFIFEELENNLHPEIQRRLFEKIYCYAIKNQSPVFITSHSHVAINCFYGKPDSLIYHVKKEIGKGSTIEDVDSHLSKISVLDDLGVKASDIFQTNGIIWVEGPSDRVYLNKWIKLVDPSLNEYEHYTYLYYGGKLLYHYSVEEGNDIINILLTNRNSAILMDSDIKSQGKDINSTKKRIASEFEKKSLFCWVTKGREIENYIKANVLDRRYPGRKYKQIGRYSDFCKYIENDDDAYASHKVKAAEGFEFDNSSLDVLDLREKVNELVSIIKKWNKLQ